MFAIHFLTARQSLEQLTTIKHVTISAKKHVNSQTN